MKEIVDKTSNKEDIFYLVKWTNWDIKYNQWLPDNKLKKAREFIRAYDASTLRKRRRQSTLSIDIDIIVLYS